MHRHEDRQTSILLLTGLGVLAATSMISVVLAEGEEILTSPVTAPAISARAPKLPELPAVDRPPTGTPEVGLSEDDHLNKTPPRKTTGLDLVRMTWTYNCMECHALLEARWNYDRPMAEHTDIKLDHGNNRFCLSCHHPTDRNSFVDYDGSAIPEEHVVELCGKCHGTIYRDWKAGVHGRENGYWDERRGAKTKLRCIQCHDPHSPRFRAMQPLGPATYPERAYNSAPAHGAGAAPGSGGHHP